MIETKDYHRKISLKKELEEVIEESRRRTVPNFYDEGVGEKIYVPVPGAELRTFHHKPKQITVKRPIVFIPGFGTTAEIWREFHQTHHGFAEYFHIETREKKPCQLKRTRNTDLSLNRLAKDLTEVINFFGLSGQDYVLMASCMTGGVVLRGLIEGYLDPPTTIILDPFTKWTQNRALIKYVMPLLPPAVLGALKYLLAKIILGNMKNEQQKQRNLATVESAVPWIWRKFSLQNINHDLTEDLKKIPKTVYIFHGPPDKYHPAGIFQQTAERIPKGRFFHIDVQEEHREILAGIIATAFAEITKKEEIPEIFAPFEVELRR
ncbi:MAG: hypothetical protein GF308_09470 [Candidatus Heimdallarchaeota archaeon]|nr:hypothetical protein [Candidatus Heimdallarchaeota archaeon]